MENYAAEIIASNRANRTRTQRESAVASIRAALENLETTWKSKSAQPRHNADHSAVIWVQNTMPAWTNLKPLRPQFGTKYDGN
jgi:hypothetical protein